MTKRKSQSTIIDNQLQLFWGWSTISNHYQQFARDYLRGQQLSTITNNCFEVVNHTAKQIVPFRAKNQQQLATIILEWSSIINNQLQFARDDLRGQQLATITNNYFLGWSSIINHYQQLFLGWSTISHNWQQVFWGGNNYRPLPTIFFAPVVAITAVVRAHTGGHRIEDN